MNDVVLKVTNLSKQYKDIKAVDRLSFSLHKGEIVGLIGSNGAGKSTTIKMITGLIKPTSGTVEICGIDISKREQALANIGAIVETPQFYPYLSARQNLEYFACFYDKFDKKRIDEVLNLVGLKDRQNDKVGKYSLGMKQRLGIAQALLNNPKILVLDEPTNGLDAEGIIQIRNFLKDIALKTKVTIFISSHILSQLQSLCDRFIIIDKGKLKDNFTKQEIATSDKKHINTFINVNDMDKALQILKQNGITAKGKNGKIYLYADKAERGKIITLLNKNGIEIYGLGNVKVELEQKFLSSIRH